MLCLISCEVHASSCVYEATPIDPCLKTVMLSIECLPSVVQLLAADNQTRIEGICNSCKL
eukprot:m.249672 g.249672  ORF g.249672 m.249672 type:complete len:60 (-) comp17513_c1_seq30:3647-3826(-)